MSAVDLKFERLQYHYETAPVLRSYLIEAMTILQRILKGEPSRVLLFTFCLTSGLCYRNYAHVK